MNVVDLDGFWRITFHYPPPLIAMMEAVSVVKNGRLAGVDIGGCTTAGSITIRDNDTIVINSVWDASRAETNVYLPMINGGYTKGQVEISAALKIFKSGDTLMASGDVPFGPMTIAVALERIGKLS
jgi:hypothetical protein